MRISVNTVLLLMLLTGTNADAQDQIDAASNPIPEAALQAPPGFGGSRPVDAPQLPAVDGSKMAPEPVAVEWKPKLIVKLAIQPRGAPKATSGTSEIQPAGLFTTPANNEATLKCDDVQVDVKTDDSGMPVYSFHCKGKAILSVSGNTITADSITTVDRKLSASNAVIEMPNGIIVRSDKLTLELTIFEIEVKSAGEERRKPGTSAEHMPRFFNGDDPFGAGN